jgi:SpoU rRNA methylase family enzyme
MKEKKSNKYNVKLLYDYHDGNSKVGSSLLLDTLDEAIEIVRIMEEFAVDKSTKKKAKFDFSNVKDYKSSHIEPISIEDEEKARKIASIKKEVFY